jgi:hypothetical protein
MFWLNRSMFAGSYFVVQLHHPREVFAIAFADALLEPFAANSSQPQLPRSMAHISHWPLISGVAL